MVKTSLRNKEDHYTDYDIENFEKHLTGSFKLTRKEVLESRTRILYYAEPM